MKLKHFTQFISESTDNAKGPITEILQRIASSAQDNGWNDFIGLDQTSSQIIAIQEWTDDGFEYNGRDVSCDIEVQFIITPIVSPEYSDSSNLQRLLGLGLAPINSIITKFNVVASLEATCEEVSEFEYSDGYDDTIDADELSGGAANLSQPEAFGIEMIETLNNWIDEFTQGGLLRHDIQGALSELEQSEGESDDDFEY